MRWRARALSQQLQGDRQLPRPMNAMELPFADRNTHIQQHLEHL
jgi:hypothetical protein